MNRKRKERLSKITKAQFEIEEQILGRRSCFEPQGVLWMEANQALGKLYYLIRLAKEAK